MANFKPASFPRRPKHSNLASELHHLLAIIYYRYEVTTAQYIMSPMEKLAFNLIVLLLTVLLVSAVYYYLPTTVLTAMQRLVYYVTGSHRLQVHGVDIVAAAGLS